MKVKIISVLLVSVFAMSANAISEKQLEKIKARIAPVGSVCVEGDESCATAAPVASAGAARSGEDVYKTACSACHSTGVLDAPKAFDEGAWGKRLAKGMDETLKVAINGLNAMPPKGSCADCSDDELKAAIEYMSKSQ